MIPKKNQHQTALRDLIDEIYSEALVSCKKSTLTRFKNILDDPFILQIIEHAEYENKISLERQEKLKKIIRRRLTAFRAFIKQEAINNNLTSIEPLEISIESQQTNKTEPVDPIFTEIESALDMYGGYLQAKEKYSGLAILWFKEYRLMGLNYIAIPAFEQYLIEKKEYLNRLGFQNSLRWIQKLIAIGPDYIEPQKDARDIIRICHYLRGKLDSTLELATLKVTSIRFKYIKASEPNKTQLKFYVNEKYRKFSGVRADICHKILQNPLMAHDLEQLSTEHEDSIASDKEYDKTFRQIEAINTGITKSFLDYGLEEFFIIEKSQVKVQRGYQHLIQEM